MLQPKSDVVFNYRIGDSSLKISIIKRESPSRIQASFETIEQNHGITISDREDTWQTVDWGVHYESIEVIEEIIRLIEAGSDYGIDYFVIEGIRSATFRDATKWKSSLGAVNTVAITLKKE